MAKIDLIYIWSI